eukprot:6555560-Pyramimonas_sp.AAC.1
MLALGPPPRSPPDSATHRWVWLLLRPRPVCLAWVHCKVTDHPSLVAVATTDAPRHVVAPRASPRQCCSEQVTAQSPAVVWHSFPPAFAEGPPQRS